MKNGQALGVLIALTGANGNVVGCYDELPDKSYLHLITQDSLRDIVKRHYHLKEVEEVKSFIQHETLHTIDSIDFIYYGKQVWWLVAYVDGGFSVLTNDMIPLDDEEKDTFLDILSKSTTFNKSDYIDPIEEKVSWIRQDILRKSIVFLPQVNLYHTKVFMNSLVDYFMSDLQNKNFSAFYFIHYGLTEYAIDTELNLKFKADVNNRSIIYKNRIGFGEMEGHVVTVQLFDQQ